MDLAAVRRLASVIADSNDAITIQDLDGRITAWNKGAQAMYGYTEEEALLMNIRDTVPEDRRAQALDLLRQAETGQVVASLETQRRTKDGHILDVWLTTTKLLDEQGKIVAIATTERDITQRKKEESTLRRLASVVRDSNDAITVQGLDGRFEAWNRGAERMYGYTESEALRMNNSQLVPENERARALDLVRQIRTGEAVDSLELQRVAKDGRTLDVWLTITKLLDDQNKVVGFATTERDITDRKRAETEKTQFINSVAHEMNTPMTPLKIQLRALTRALGESLTAPQRRSLDIVARSVERLGRLIQDALDSTRVQANRLGLNKQQVDLGGLVTEVVEGYKASAEAANLTLTSSVEPAITINADPGRIAQALANLLSNALKFTPEKGRVSVELKRAGSGALVRVQDTGVGIPADQIEALFKPFSQLPAGRAKTSGTGLGLYISRGIVSLHEGKLWCESPGANQGSAFLFWLPLGPGEGDPVTGLAQGPRQGSS